jgi:hypothetical protein
MNSPELLERCGWKMPLFSVSHDPDNGADDVLQYALDGGILYLRDAVGLEEEVTMVHIGGFRKRVLKEMERFSDQPESAGDIGIARQIFLMHIDEVPLVDDLA